MSLRPAGVCLGALTALIAIVGAWGGDGSIAMLWRLPAGLLLAGLAYESLLIARAGLKFDVEAPERWFLGRPGSATFLFRHSLGRRVLIEWVPSAPSGFAFDGAVRSVSVPAFAAAPARFTGTVQRRKVTFEGERMTLSPPPSVDPLDGKMSLRTLTWEKV